jgi:hypothetical protein
MDKRAIAVVLIVIGAGLIYWGYDISQSVRGQFTRLWSGGVPDRAMLAYLGGAACAALGVYLLARSR